MIDTHELDLIFSPRPPHCCTASKLGWLIGIRQDYFERWFKWYPCNCHFEFIDNKFKKPNFQQLIEVVKKIRPKYAVAPDIFPDSPLKEIIDVYHNLKLYSKVILVPKSLQAVKYIDSLNEDFIVGFSTGAYLKASKYAATLNYDPIPFEWFAQYPIHILGGNPHLQLSLLEKFPNIVSADGNMIDMIARRFGKYWKAGKWLRAPELTRNQLVERSLTDIKQAWIDAHEDELDG